MKYFLSLFFLISFLIRGKNIIGYDIEFKSSNTDTIFSGNYYFINDKVYDSSQNNTIIEDSILQAAIVPIYDFIIVRKKNHIAFGNKDWNKFKINNIVSFQLDFNGDLVYANIYTSNDTVLIDLLNKRITTIPISSEWLDSVDNIKEYHSVFKLNLSNKKLTQLPENICQFKQLASLSIYNNALTGFPIDFFKLQKLEELVLSNNELTFLPKEIGLLKDLHILNLRNNQLSELPIEIKQLKNLQELDLRGNNFADENKKKIKNWFNNSSCEVYFDEVADGLEEH
jgi:Leucine-rich repeat (LRR) protein